MRSWGPDGKAETLKEIFRSGWSSGSCLRNCYPSLPIGLATGSQISVHAPLLPVIPSHLAVQVPALQAAASMGPLGLEQGRAGTVLGNGTAGQGTHLQLDRPFRPAAQLAAAQGPAPRLQHSREDQLAGRPAPLEVGPLQTQAEQAGELLIEPKPAAAPPLGPRGGLACRQACGCGARCSPLQATAPQRPLPAAHPLQAPLGPLICGPTARHGNKLLALDEVTPLAAAAGRSWSEPQGQRRTRLQRHPQRQGQTDGRAQ